MRLRIERLGLCLKVRRRWYGRWWPVMKWAKKEARGLSTGSSWPEIRSIRQRTIETHIWVSFVDLSDLFINRFQTLTMSTLSKSKKSYKGSVSKRNTISIENRTNPLSKKTRSLDQLTQGAVKATKTFLPLVTIWSKLEWSSSFQAGGVGCLTVDVADEWSVMLLWV